MRSGLLAIPLEGSDLDHYASQLGCADRATAAAALGRAIAASDGLRELGPIAIATRGGTSSAVGIFGSLSESDWRWLARQAAAQSAVCATVRFVDYREAARLASRLAAAILSEVGQEGLGGWRFEGLPRGGLIVLGMLGYALGLPGDRLLAEPGWRGPRIVVDDCALSGARFRRALAASDGGPVLFAHLLSVAELRQRIEGCEPRVRRCLAAADLDDCGSAVLGAGYDEWRARLGARLGGDRYWVGVPAALGFAWSEPDRVLWDPDSDRLRLAWNLLPPELCLSHRQHQTAVQIQAEGTGGWSLPEGVLSADLDGRVLVGDSRSGDVMELSEEAAAMWRALLAAATPAEALQAVAAELAVPQTLLARDLKLLTAELEERGLLEARSPGAEGG